MGNTQTHLHQKAVAQRFQVCYVVRCQNANDIILLQREITCDGHVPRKLACRQASEVQDCADMHEDQLYLENDILRALHFQLCACILGVDNLLSVLQQNPIKKVAKEL